MKKTIAAVALLASSNAMAFPGPIGQNPPKPTTICLNVYAGQPDKSKYASDCDDSDNNVTLQKAIKQNGCAAKQVAIVSYDGLNIPKCMPAGVVQL